MTALLPKIHEGGWWTRGQGDKETRGQGGKGQGEKDQEDVVLDVEIKKFVSGFWEISRQSANTV
ncbi:hypothetical protein [Nostoc sp. CCY0012]|uniref:hypothetical protein n=1 Tax=Nostoc sp. CCY0012 TaxID=1056123 RepID=UPI0039C5D30A